MSGFKRYQSKVFWHQMELQDQQPHAVVFKQPAPQHQDEGEEEEEEQEEALSLSAEEDSDAPDNQTVIHICPPTPASASKRKTKEAKKQDHQRDQEQEQLEAVGAGEEHQDLALRSFSPASRGQRSQDSGFSDSGRSDDSSAELDDPSGEQPARRRRTSGRRRSSRRRRAEEQPQLPQQVPTLHTSTPKQEVGARVIRSRELDQLSRQLDFSPRQPDEAPECLNDFLYDVEPPIREAELEHSSIRPESPPPPYTEVRDTPANGGLESRAPVRLWLGELRDETEDECMATLQSKSLPRRRLRDDEPESRDLRLLTASATTAAKKVIDCAARFDKRYSRAIRSIQSPNSAKMDRQLLQSIEDEATEILTKYGASMPTRHILNHRQQSDPQTIALQFSRLKNKVDRAFDHRLDFYIEKVVRGLEEAPRENGSTARGALAALTALGLAGPRAASSIARCSGIRALLTSLVSSARMSSDLRSCVLRALGSVCCCIEAVDQFVREDGPEILLDLLTAESTPDTEKSEGTALLVQITAPWMDYVGLPYVEPHAFELVGSITDLAERTSCKQTLLLAAAAINHLAHSKRCIAAIIKCDSIKKLLRCVKKKNGGSVCLMEQVASLIGLVARVPQARAHLVDTRASVALVCFLRMQPPGLEDEYRRLESTAREALTRLCVDPEIAQQVVAIGGSNCLPSSECSGRECQGAAAEIHGGGFKSTQSLRVARKIAAEQIDMARIKDHSPR